MKQFITAIDHENLRFEIHLRFIEFKHTEFFTSHGGYLLNTTLYVPGARFSVVGLDRAKFRFYLSHSFLFIVVIMISIFLKNCILTNFNS